MPGQGVDHRCCRRSSLKSPADDTSARRRARRRAREPNCLAPGRPVVRGIAVRRQVDVVHPDKPSRQGGRRAPTARSGASRTIANASASVRACRSAPSECGVRIVSPSRLRLQQRCRGSASAPTWNCMPSDFGKRDRLAALDLLQQRRRRATRVRSRAATGAIGRLGRAVEVPRGHRPWCAPRSSPGPVLAPSAAT